MQASGDHRQTGFRLPTRIEIKPSGAFRRSVRLSVSALAWAWFFLLMSVTSYLVAGVLLAFALAGNPFTSEAPLAIILGVLLALTAGAGWAVAKFVATPRAVFYASGVVVSIGLVVTLTFVAAVPEDALYMARTAAWGDSDVHDYERFPQRAIASPSQAFHFRQAESPMPRLDIEYSVDGQQRRGEFPQLLAGTSTNAFIVIKDDAIVYEGYFNGYQRDSIVTSFSVAKSFISALVGIAIDEGYIGGVDDPVTAYIPELRGRGFDGLTVRHLLTMSSGVRFTTGDDVFILRRLLPTQDDALAYYHPNLRSRVLKIRPDGTAPGTYFHYNDYLTQLAGMILERTTHRPVAQYLQEKIWQPLGMEFPASWSLDSEEHGFEQMQAGLNARAIDFAKFGRLFLNIGTWNGVQVVPSAWVLESTTRDPRDQRDWRVAREWKDAGGYYKYFWWGKTLDDGGYDFYASGKFNQKIYVSPAEKLIIVRFGSADGIDDWSTVFEQIKATLHQ